MTPTHEATNEDEDDPICGGSYDHDLMLRDERDGIRAYECRVCGAEVVDDEEGTPS